MTAPPSLHKSDRLPPPSESAPPRVVTRVSTRHPRRVIRDVMRGVAVRPHSPAKSLRLTTSDLSAKIPPFNAQRMLTEVSAARPRLRRRSQQRRRASNPMPRFRFVTKDLASVLRRRSSPR